MDTTGLPDYIGFMKQLILILTLLMTPTLALLAARGSSAPTAKLTVSCAVCNAGDTITVSGSGFAKRSSVAITLSGPIGGTSYAQTDAKGRFSIGYALGASYPAGQYDISASSAGAYASIGFEIQ